MTEKINPLERYDPVLDPKNWKKPQLFYYEEAGNAWIPAPDKIENIIDVVYQLDEGDEIEIRFKRVDISDAEIEQLPEC